MLNFSNPSVFLTWLVFLPAFVALVITFLPMRDEMIKRVSLIATAVVFLMTLHMIFGSGQVHFAAGKDGMQNLFSVPWIPSFNIHYLMGTDGISFPLIVLTAFVSLLAMGASWPIKKYVKGYCILFLLLETGMLGVFCALDFFLFYVFWEVMLLPMYFLIGVWGGPRKEYAAIKFFLYTLVGSVLMLIAILMLYFNSDLRALKDKVPTQQIIATGVVNPASSEADQQEELQTILSSKTPVHTFNILAMQLIGQKTDLYTTPSWGGHTLAWWAFVLLGIGFIIKVPSVPFHTWLPDAHVEAPTPISMILAGVLLKMGGYGLIRVCYPVCPSAGYDLAWVVCFIGVLSMVYGAFAAMAQTDFKRLVAYSSVSHMGYVVLGLGVWSAFAGTQFNPDYWQMGMNGAMFQMIAHGISSAGMFFLVGVVYDRVHHRNLNEFGGLFAKMPVYSGIAVGIFFAGLGLPGLCGFIGEMLVVLSVWNFNITLAVISAAVVILTAGYILWAIQRVYLGAEYKGPHAEALTPLTIREFSIAAPLLALAIFFGVNPNALLKYMQPSVNKTVVELTNWTKDHKDQIPARPTAANTPDQTAETDSPQKPSTSPQKSLTTEFTEKAKQSS